MVSLMGSSRREQKAAKTAKAAPSARAEAPEPAPASLGTDTRQARQRGRPVADSAAAPAGTGDAAPVPRDALPKEKGVPVTDVDPIQATFLRLRFYRARAKVLTLVALVLVGLIGANAYLAHTLATTPRLVRLYPVDEVGRRLNPPALSYGHLDPEEELIPWVQETLEMTYTYNYLHFQRQWNLALQRFTPEGRSGFEAQLIRNNRVEIIRRDGLVVRTRITGPLHVCPFPETYVYNERREMWRNPGRVFEWVVLAPFRTDTQQVGSDEDTRLPVEGMFMVRVQRQPVLRSALGVGVRLVVDFDRDLFGEDPCADLQRVLAQYGSN